MDVIVDPQFHHSVGIRVKRALARRYHLQFLARAHQIPGVLTGQYLAPAFQQADRLFLRCEARSGNAAAIARSDDHHLEMGRLPLREQFVEGY
ncbi:hypothetical protein [Alterinioella nitratireducens]|uniref:hypothetical protein n=1 Tax=Alterinioella nitratireducens TaxID=2735915 RepID=UPI004057FE14